MSLVIPTTEGMYGIQAMHENLVAAVTIGVVKYTLPDGTRCHAAVSNGIVKVENNEVLILVESAEDPDDIDEERALQEEQMARDAKRLVLFAPSMYPWNEMEYELENTIRKDMNKGNGGRDLELDDVIALIANSIA